MSEVYADSRHCTVCLDDFRSFGSRKPRILPVCLHTFCEGCLDRLAVDNDYSVPCPICRVFNDVFGLGGIQALPISTRVPLLDIGDEEAEEEADVLNFIDPNMPSCPLCSSMTLYAPFGVEADITQCHTCQWVSAEVMEVTETREQVDPVAQVTPPPKHNGHVGQKPKKAKQQTALQAPPRRQTLLGRIMSYTR
ncbi:hypothetical protein NDU88_011735 [Pleurodeles waltl]|uniref:RING-type domain-containing protein n=1 Tax=Pleurodeles waltl TaxID=8319 RepID=A0AAV7QZZ3_PLEWA|nr:hypothetical protein NDU88_011735 [Pleurodeles waltl]